MNRHWFGIFHFQTLIEVKRRRRLILISNSMFQSKHREAHNEVLHWFLSLPLKSLIECHFQKKSEEDEIGKSGKNRKRWTKLRPILKTCDEFWRIQRGVFADRFFSVADFIFLKQSADCRLILHWSGWIRSFWKNREIASKLGIGTYRKLRIGKNLLSLLLSETPNRRNPLIQIIQNQQTNNR